MDTRLSQVVSVLALAFATASAVGQFEIEIDHARASNAVFAGSASSVSPLAVAADPALADAVVFDLSVGTASDILLFNAELNVTAGSLYVAPGSLGLNTATQPNPSLASVFPEVAVTSYISTPGSTAAADSYGLDGRKSTFTYFDTSNDGAQSSFPFGRITLIPDANGNISADLTGALQTRSEHVASGPLDDVFSFKLGGPSTAPVSFEDAVHYRPNETYLRNVYRNVSDSERDSRLDPVVAAANDKSRYPNGVTMFVANNTERLSPYFAFSGRRKEAGFTPFDLDVGRFAVVDGDLSGDSGWNVGDLQDMVPNQGDAVELESISERVFKLSHDEDGFSYGSARIVRSHKVDNGWVHVVDTLPHPEPLSADLLEGLTCDGDGDGDCDAGDLDAMYAEAGGGGKFDFDANDAVDFRDLEWWLSLASRAESNSANPHSRTYVEGDLDLDFDVDQDDIDIFSANIGMTDPSWAHGDLTMNGQVDWRDLEVIRENFGFVSPIPATVPEPTIGLLWLLATIGIAMRYQRRRE